MDYIGIDLHKNSSQVCIVTGDGELIERRIRTERESFDKLFGEMPPARILVESSTESEWCARHLEALGHEVIVADPNFAPMYATRDRRIKTDKRDARALCEACRLGAYRAAHRTSDRQRDVRAHLSVREALIRTRSKYISLIGALARREGCRIKAGPSPSFARRVEQAGLPAHTLIQIEPPLIVLKAINGQIRRPTSGSKRSPGRTRWYGGCAAYQALGRWSPPLSPRRSTRRHASSVPNMSAPTWGWCRASTARASGSTGGGSARLGACVPGRCWSRRRGRCCGGRPKGRGSCTSGGRE